MTMGGTADDENTVFDANGTYTQNRLDEAVPYRNVERSESETFCFVSVQLIGNHGNHDCF